MQVFLLVVSNFDIFSSKLNECIFALNPEWAIDLPRLLAFRVDKSKLLQLMLARTLIPR